jgi:lipopolysaccharide transport system permease protein
LASVVLLPETACVTSCRTLLPPPFVIDGFRWAILGGDSQIHPTSFILSLALSVVLLGAGVWCFRKTEKTFADVI